MPTALQFRRGTTSQNNSFTGVVGEISVDTTLDTLRVHDGSTAGGFLVTSRSSQYADIAERYHADAVYDTGTVLVFGGEFEVTQSTEPEMRTFAGVVSSDETANVIMNSPHRAPDLTDDTHPPLALIGRVPCKVKGFIRKGDMMTSSEVPGVASAWRSESNPPYGSVIGKSLEDSDGEDTKIIEVAVGIR